MQEAKLRANDIFFNASISACERGGQWKQALVLLGGMPGAEVQADDVSFSAAISACKRAEEEQAPGTDLYTLASKW